MVTAKELWQSETSFPQEASDSPGDQPTHLIVEEFAQYQARSTILTSNQPYIILFIIYLGLLDWRVHVQSGEGAQ